MGSRLDKNQQTWYNFNQKNVQQHFENPDNKNEDHHQVPKGSTTIISNNTFKVLRVRKAQNQPMKFWEEALKSESLPDHLENITEETHGGEVQNFDSVHQWFVNYLFGKERFYWRYFWNIFPFYAYDI